MKATTIILAAALTLSLNALFAGNDGAVSNSATISFLNSLAPRTPSVATFEEVTESALSFINLAPALPAEADFSDVAPEMSDISSLAPVTPAEADFESEDFQTPDITILAPATPVVADFTDGI